MARAALPLLLLYPAFSQPSAARRFDSRSLLTAPIDESRLVTLRGNVHPAVSTAADNGRVADSLPLEHMFLQLRRSPERERAFVRLIDQLHDPGSPNFHHWLTPEQIGSRFGPSAQDIAAITGWLEGHRFAVNVVYPDRMAIDFSGTAGAITEAFHTEIHRVGVNGQSHLANMSDPRIPEALAPAVTGVVALHDFRPRTMHRMRSDYTGGRQNHTVEALVPADLATIYNFTPLFQSGITGAGQTIAVVEDTDMDNAANWGTFRTKFGLAGYTTGSLATVHPAPALGSNNCLDPGLVVGNDGEADLDAEWASAAAPGAAIEVASCADTLTFGGLIALQNMLSRANPPSVVSVSYGLCESENGTTGNQSFYAAYQSAVAMGVSIFVAAGDEGPSSCDYSTTNATQGITVSGFASTPYNVAVGGTDFVDTHDGTTSTYWSATNSSTYGSALSYIPEMPWDDSCANELIYPFFGFAAAYGPGGMCNTPINPHGFPAAGLGNFLTTVAGSGGPSNQAAYQTRFVLSGWPKPSWQAGMTGNPGDGVRDIPDVSLFAANGKWGHYYVFCYTDPAGGGAPCTGEPNSWAGAGGTSFSSPILAGVQALVNQKTASRWGNPNTTYYSLAANSANVCNSSSPSGAGCIFYDVTRGDINVPCTGTKNCYGSTSPATLDARRKRALTVFGVLSTSDASFVPAYPATPGWDFATGLGTINVANLVNHW